MTNNPNAIVVAIPKQDTTLILRQSDAILELKRRMKPGVHYGPPYPGSTKDTLLKPGAEWLAKRFGLRAHYEELTKRIDIDFDRPERTFILFEYRCLMIDIETDTVVGEAIGSANSREEKYAWRWVSEYDLPPGIDPSRLLSKDGTLVEFDFAVRKAETSGKYGKPAEYWKAFQDAVEDRTAVIIQKEDSKGVKRPAYQIGGRIYRMSHENPLDLLNTLSKMAQKRSNVSSTMAATGASSYFAPGDDEVKDIYITADDLDVVDAVLVAEVVDEDSKPASEPSASIKGAGVYKAPQSAEPEPPPIVYDEMPDIGRAEPTSSDSLSPNEYRVDALIVSMTRTAKQFAVRLATGTVIQLGSTVSLSELSINGKPVPTLERGTYPVEWVMQADKVDGDWEIHALKDAVTE